MNLASRQESATWSLSPPDLLAELGCDPAVGLTAAEAAHRLEAGANVLPTTTPPSVLALVLSQLRETMIVVLLLAGLATAVTGDGSDTAIIAMVVVLNTALGVSQERRAQRAVSALAQLSSPTARVTRSGLTVVVAASSVVPGDLVELQAGDLVPADARILEADGLSVDEALLTGESEPAHKDVTACPADAPVADRTCMVHAGTAVARGRARAVVTATGGATELGRVAHLIASTIPPLTPLQLRLATFAKQVALAVLTLCAVVLGIGLLRGEPLGRMLLTSISLAVAAVPESLPAVVALSLALAAQRMAHRAAVVRTLPAVEALGSVTVIATDKTGTLTEGLMSVRVVWTPAGEVRCTGDGYAPDGELVGAPAAVLAADGLLRAVVLCNDADLVETARGWAVAGDPMEGALLALGSRGGLHAGALRLEHPRLSAYPFDHTRARMTTAHSRPADDRVLVLCKGSPERVLQLVEPASAAAAMEEVSRLTAQGLRVLAVASAVREERPSDVTDAESGLRLLGLVGLHDPPREQAAAAVRGCQDAGLTVLMITGDHPATAASVARSVGLLGPGDTVTTGAELADLSAADLALVRVFARTAPEQKLDIVSALQAAGQVVAMTGDGVNDAPALRSADVGVAMGRSGTQVARQAADVVLTDDDFGTVVAAVEEGRRVYDNVRRFLLYALTGGAAEVLLMLLGPFLGMPLPLLPGQILWVNLLTHGLPGVALGAERAEADVLRRPPRDPHQGVLADGLLRSVLLLGAVVAATSLSLGAWAQQHGHPWQSMVFVVLTLQQLWIAVALRSMRRPALRVGLRGNPMLLGSLVLNSALLWLAVDWSPLAELLGTVSLDLTELAVCLGASLVAPVAAEVGKALGRRAVGPATAGPRPQEIPS